MDTDADVVAEVGYGDVGADPATWTTWAPIEPNPGWNGSSSGEPNNDEYTGWLTAPSAQVDPYEFAIRFSMSCGVGWRYCDRDAGGGADGAQDDYQSTNAGRLTVP